MAQITFTGNVARPELKELGGKPACTFSAAENHQRKNRQTGNYEDSGTTWRRVTYFGNRMLSPQALFDAINHKGAMVLVTGREETNTWTDKDGVEQNSLEVTADYAAPLQKDGGGSQRSQGGGHGAQTDPWGGNTNSGFGGAQQGGGGFGNSGGFGGQNTEEVPPPF